MSVFQEKVGHGFLLNEPGVGWIAAGIVIALSALTDGCAPAAPRQALQNVPSLGFTVETPSGTALASVTSPLALSPDGRFLVYVGQNDSTTQLYIRGPGDLGPRALSGTDRAGRPFFSPDGNWIAFFSAGALRKISRNGGPVIALAQGVPELPATWTPDNRIILPRTGGRRGLSQIPAGGGTPKALTVSDSAHDKRHWNPLVLPDNKTFLFVNQGPGGSEDDYLAIGSADRGDFTILDVHASKPLGYTAGHAVYSADGKIMAAPLDIRRRALTGDPVAVMEGLADDDAISLSPNGTLAFGNSAFRLVWADEKGQTRNVLEEPAKYQWPRLSPDGTQIALTISGSTAWDVWIYNIATGTRTRLNTESAGAGPRTPSFGGERPEWTPDGKRVIFMIPGSPPRAGLWWQPVDRSGPAERLKTIVPGNVSPPVEGVMSPDGRTILFRILSGSNGRDLYYFTVGRNEPAQPWLTTKSNEVTPRFSPDGKWVAYASDESNQYEVYVRPFSVPGAQYQISVGGGVEPVWSRDGRRVYYRKGGEMMVAEVASSNGIEAVSRRPLFAWRALPDLGHANYDVSADGKLLMIQSDGEDSKMVVITNWFTELREKLALKR